MKLFQNKMRMLVAACVAGLTVAGALRAADGQREPDEYELMALFSKASQLIRENYVDEGKTSYDELVRGALQGMIQSLDPDSQLIVEPPSLGLEEGPAGEFGGIGVVINMKGGVLNVIATLDDTPGLRAGLRSGDAIVEIAGETTDEMTLADAVKALRGPPGSVVSLKVLSPGSEDVNTVEVTREVIRVASVKEGRAVATGIGYVRIAQFTESAPEQLAGQVQNLLTRGAKAMILDVRGTAGGLDSAALDMAQRFLKRGATMAVARGRSGRDEQVFHAKGAAPMLEVPMVVLVDNGTAGPGEVLAAALRDNRRAALVGQKTYGRGSIQSVIPLDERSSIRLTTALFYTPGGQAIQNQGVVPDVEVEMSREQWQRVLTARSAFTNAATSEMQGVPGASVDLQLERAITILKAKLELASPAKSR